MSTAAVTQPPDSRVNYLNANYGFRSWLLTTDHKRIALLYLMSITVHFFHRRRGGHADAFALDHAERHARPARNV